MDPASIAAIIVGVISLVGTIVGSVTSGVSTDKTNQTSKDIAEENNATSLEIAENNLNFEKEKFGYDKYLNENQNQISAMDMSKAGLNPLTGSLANLSTVGVGGGQLPSLQAPNLIPQDFSKLGDSLGSALRTVTDTMLSKGNIKAQLESAENINDVNNMTSLLGKLPDILTTVGSSENSKNWVRKFFKDVPNDVFDSAWSITASKLSNEGASTSNIIANTNLTEEQLNQLPIILRNNTNLNDAQIKSILGMLGINEETARVNNAKTSVETRGLLYQAQTTERTGVVGNDWISNVSKTLSNLINEMAGYNDKVRYAEKFNNWSKSLNFDSIDSLASKYGSNSMAKFIKYVYDECPSTVKPSTFVEKNFSSISKKFFHNVANEYDISKFKSIFE